MSKTIGQLMTHTPVTIPQDLSLADARRRMFDHGIRHLPVLEAERVVGILSDRDISMVSSIPGVDAERVQVGSAMTDHPFTCSPRDTLAAVAATMIERKIGAAVVMDEGAVVGMFTTIDAMRELVRTSD